MRVLLLAGLLALLSGCVTPISLDQQVPDVSYTPNDIIAIAVVDDRKRVREGKDPTFVGKAHATFGIPVDWHVKHIFTTEQDDKERTLAEVLQYRMVVGLQNDGWKVVPVNEEAQQKLPDLNAVLADTSADTLVMLTLNEWYFSINLNWVSAFNFDTNVDVSVKTLDPDLVFAKNITERDVIDEEASQSPQNKVFEAYRDQLIQVLEDPDVKAAVMRESFQ